MDSKDLLAVVSLLIPVSFIVLLLAAYSADMIDQFLTSVAVVVLVAVIIAMVLYFIFGMHAFIKKKDTVHYGSSMTLDDVKEVDREMEKK